jgi:uncharacterized protein (TIGR02996 family)
MGDGEALLRAILDQPKEDTPRLVYADWCDENGQPERAEFIRVQVRLAGMKDEAAALEGMMQMPVVFDLDKAMFKGKPISPEFWDRIYECRGLQLREKELWASNSPTGVAQQIAREWPVQNNGISLHLGDVRQRIPGYFSLVSRGFISSLTCAWFDWRTHADAILAAQPVERVRLTTWPPALRHPDDVTNFRGACKFRWPGIEFELPPVPGEVGGRRATMTFFDEYQSLREWWDNHTQAHTQ